MISYVIRLNFLFFVKSRIIKFNHAKQIITSRSIINLPLFSYVKSSGFQPFLILQVCGSCLLWSPFLETIFLSLKDNEAFDLFRFGNSRT